MCEALQGEEVGGAHPSLLQDPHAPAGAGPGLCLWGKGAHGSEVQVLLGSACGLQGLRKGLLLWCQLQSMGRGRGFQGHVAGESVQSFPIIIFQRARGDP